MKIKTNSPRLIETYDARLKNATIFNKALASVRLPEKIKLYGEINNICRTQTEDCVDGFALASLLAVSELYGLKRRRLERLMARTQEILDEASTKYEIGVGYALRTQLEQISGLRFGLHTESEEEA